MPTRRELIIGAASMAPAAAAIAVDQKLEHVFPEPTIPQARTETGVSPQVMLGKQLQENDELAWVWHCNIASCALCEGNDHQHAQMIAVRAMWHLFSVDTEKLHRLYYPEDKPLWPAIDLVKSPDFS